LKISLNIFYCQPFSLLCLVFFLLCSCEINQTESEKNNIAVIDSVAGWMNLAKNSQIDKETKLQFLRKSSEYISSIENDSLKVKFFLKIADRYYDLDQDSLFLTTNKIIYSLAQKINDTAAIAEHHWNKGNLLSDREVLDSAFYQYNLAYKLYSSLNNEYYRAKMAYNMSYVQFRMSNYIESEILVVSAIKGFTILNKNFNLYRCYNRLLLLDKEVGNFEGAIDHYFSATKYLNKANKSGVHKEKLLNNLSLVYQKQKKYQKAIDALDKALSNKDLRAEHPNLFAKLIDNRAYCKYLKGEEKGILDDFNLALYLRDSMDNKAGIGISKMHLSEYYLKNGDSLRAYQTALDAYNLSHSLGLNRDELSSLVLLSRADPSHATAYMSSYTTLNDSLLLEERKVRNKFTRIQFETEDHIAANKDLKIRNGWITLTSIMAVVSLSMLIFGYRQKSQNKTLLLDQYQQKANQEIYDLMLKQQNREEEGRIQERIRISEDLHDGVLARLFSARIGLGLLNFISSQKVLEQFHKLIDDFQLVEKEIRDISHDLKTDELSSKKDFPKLLFELLEEQSSIGNFSYQLEKDDSIAWNQVDEKIKINLFRTVQEAVYNALKYAKCKKIKICLKRRKNEVVLIIADDGKGFDTNKKNRGIGLKNMRSRARSIGAVLDIKSIPKKGTTIEVRITTKILYHEAVT